MVALFLYKPTLYIICSNQDTSLVIMARGSEGGQRGVRGGSEGGQRGVRGGSEGGQRGVRGGSEGGLQIEGV